MMYKSQHGQWVVLVCLLTFQSGAALQCLPGEFPVYVVSGGVLLDLGQVGDPSPVTVPNVADARACQRQCDNLETFSCVSFTYQVVQQSCHLYARQITDAGVTTTEVTDGFHYTGICSESPDLTNCNQTSEKVDLAFVVDGSGSICDNDPTRIQEGPRATCNNWRSIKQFINVLVQFLTIGPDQTQIALVTFSNEGRVYFQFDSYTTKEEIEEAIDGLPFDSGNTNTYEGLNLMRTVVFNQTKGDRPDGRDVAIVITDGFPTVSVGFPSENETEAEATAAQDDGVIMYAVGITDKIDESWLKIFSSSPKTLNQNYFTSPDFDSLQPLISSLLSAACIPVDPEIAPPETTTEPPTTAATTVTTNSVPTEDPSDDFSVLRYFLDYPVYAAMIGMGILILLLFITAVVILCCYTSRRQEEDNYEQYPDLPKD